MSRFTTRVELYGSPVMDDYTKLHASMLRIGFSRVIETGEAKYILPQAEYNISSDKSTKEILDLAKSAAIKVWKDFAVLVTRTEVTREFHNLELVK